MKKILFITHLPLHLRNNSRATSSIIKSGQKDTEASVHIPAVPIVVGALGTISQNLPKYLQNLEIKEENQGRVTRNLQKADVLGSLKIMKAFMKM